MEQKLLNLILTFKDKETALSTLGILKDAACLDVNEAGLIEEYTALLKSISTVPNRELLIQKFPNQGFEYAKGYAEETLLSNVELFLDGLKYEGIGKISKFFSKSGIGIGLLLKEAE